MKIGIDISQLAYSNTGVANYMAQLVENMIVQDTKNEYILFYSSLRRNFPFSIFNFYPKGTGQSIAAQFPNNVTMRTFKFPPKFLDLLWNRLHIAPIEWFVGSVDVFITSDWTEPPAASAKKATIIHDMTVYTHPDETAQSIQNVQKRKLKWVTRESDIIFVNSNSTKQDVAEIFDIPKEKITVIYPGI